MKRFVILFIALAISTTTIAQNAAEIKSFDPSYKYELYRPYPVENVADAPRTDAPKGFKPFYISTLARHGSRHHSSTSSYTDISKVFEAAHDRGELTPLGERFRADWLILAYAAENRAGELTQLGQEQHRGIMHRIIESYPEIFSTKGGRRCFVDCRSTIVPRCILSMAAAVAELKSLRPNVEVRMESSEANTYLKAYAGLNSVAKHSLPLSDSLRRANMPDPSAFIGRLFKEGSTSVAEIESVNDFMYKAFLGVGVLGSTPHPQLKDLSYIFTEEEAAAVWRASNIRRYALTGPCKSFQKQILGGIKPFVRNVISTADRAITEGDEQATLRFAHDVTVIPFSAFVGIPSCNVITDDFENVSHKWQINKVTPMAANIQLVFYRNKSGEVLVKVLHNEYEQRLDEAVGKPINGVYYRWNDLRQYMMNKLEE